MSDAPNQFGSHCAHPVASDKYPPTITNITATVFSAVRLAVSAPIYDKVYKEFESRQDRNIIPSIISLTSLLQV